VFLKHGRHADLVSAAVLQGAVSDRWVFEQHQRGGGGGAPIGWNARGMIRSGWLCPYGST
jgi:hypothetical protein